MISIESFKEIRSSNHLIVLDTNVLLELYRQPANISLDIIEVLKKILDQIYIPRRVYTEFSKNRQKICGDEKKKYENVTKELSEMTRKLQESITKRIAEYRKHNYTDVTKLQKDLLEKIGDTQGIINDYKKNHAAEIQLNIDFLRKDGVNAFVDILKQHGCIGAEIPFMRKLEILREGELRYDNLIPPGFMDEAKVGEDRFGDLFIWKDILSVAKERECNILFVCNDIKDDWWKKEKGEPDDLRQELEDEFTEINPTLHIHFLTLDRFFSYLAEEFKMAKSKSALQLTAIQDVKEMLADHEEHVNAEIQSFIGAYDWQSELDEGDWDAENENMYWNLGEVSVEKEEKRIIYYVNIDISVLADLERCEEKDKNYNEGKLAWSLTGNIVIETEEYSNISEIREVIIESGDILHIQSDTWDIIGDKDNQLSCKEIILLCKSKLLDFYHLEYEGLENIVRSKAFESMSKMGKQMSLALREMNPIIWGEGNNLAQMSTILADMVKINPEQANQMRKAMSNSLLQLGTIIDLKSQKDTKQEEKDSKEEEIERT